MTGWTPELFDTSTATAGAEKFRAWVHSPGGRHVAREVYRQAAGYGARYVRTGQRVSCKLLWELVRDRIRQVSLRAALLGVRIDKVDGYSLNNIFTPHMARHILAHRPEWNGMFETREVGRQRRRKAAVVEIQERKANAV